MAKPELEFFAPDSIPWQRVEGPVDGLYEKILSLDPESGSYTRMLRFEPGTDTTPNGTLTHDFEEEVWILEGALTDLRLNQTFTAGMYASRPPGMEHGPWVAPHGCTTFELRHYLPPARQQAASDAS